MSNPFAGIITPEFKTLFTNAIDALLEDTALTVPCRLIYGTTKNLACPNCNIDSITGMSANTYKSGGPVPFPDGGICPMCQGAYYIPQDTSTSLNLAVIWNNQRAKFLNVNAPLKIDGIYAQTISKIVTFPTLVAAKEAILDTSIAGYADRHYQRIGPPAPIDFGIDPYIVTLWQKAGG